MWQLANASREEAPANAAHVRKAPTTRRDRQNVGFKGIETEYHVTMEQTKQCK